MLDSEELEGEGNDITFELIDVEAILVESIDLKKKVVSRTYLLELYIFEIIAFSL